MFTVLFVYKLIVYQPYRCIVYYMYTRSYRVWLHTQHGAPQINMQERPDGKHARMEKYLLRKAFDDPENPYLPESVLWRQKEQFSDGVGYDWVDGLKVYAESMVSDADWATRAERCAFCLTNNLLTNTFLTKTKHGVC